MGSNMVPCGISWCVAMADDKQFCPIHEKYQALHPREVEVEQFVDDDEFEGEDDEAEDD